MSVGKRMTPQAPFTSILSTDVYSSSQVTRTPCFSWQSWITCCHDSASGNRGSLQYLFPRMALKQVTVLILWRRPTLPKPLRPLDKCPLRNKRTLVEHSDPVKMGTPDAYGGTRTLSLNLDGVLKGLPKPGNGRTKTSGLL
jgi:hypothetical protein